MQIPLYYLQYREDDVVPCISQENPGVTALHLFIGEQENCRYSIIIYFLRDKPILYANSIRVCNALFNLVPVPVFYIKQKRVIDIILNHWNDIYRFSAQSARRYKMVYNHNIIDDYRKKLNDYVVDLINNKAFEKFPREFIKRVKFIKELRYPNKELFTNVIIQFANQEFYTKKALFIQKTWRDVISNPCYVICRQRLFREFTELV